MVSACIVLMSVGVQAENIAVMDGVVAVADSQHRDRWGVDGYHAQFVCDGKADDADRVAAWAGCGPRAPAAAPAICSGLRQRVDRASPDPL